MIRDAASAATLGTRRLRAAADMAYAAAVYGDALTDAKFHSPHAPRDPAVKAAAAYVKQTRLVYDNARADHERALDAAAGHPASPRRRPSGGLCALSEPQHADLPPALVADSATCASAARVQPERNRFTRLLAP